MLFDEPAGLGGVLPTDRSHELMVSNVWATSFADTEIARRKAWGGRDDLRVAYDTASPTSLCNIGQHGLEPILRPPASATGRASGSAPNCSN